MKGKVREKLENFNRNNDKPIKHKTKSHSFFGIFVEHAIL